jgi:ABC-type multidrug transport system ATPase subunit
MSEEILKALMELFALVVKQDGGLIRNERDYVVAFLNNQLTSDTVDEYLALFDEQAGPVISVSGKTEPTAPSVRDSVKILTICKKINRTLNQVQKVVVVMRLFELINADRKFTPQRMNIINTVAEVFRVPPDEFTSIEKFAKSIGPEKLEDPSIIILRPGEVECKLCKKMHEDYHGAIILFLRIASVDLYFFKYIFDAQLYLNGLPVTSGNIYIFAKGGSIKSQHGHAIYYSDISASFLSDVIIHKLSYNAENLSFRFSNGVQAIENISVSIEEGNLVGILGASGSGKTTLLNLMTGIQKPDTGSVTINCLDLFEDNIALEGVIGYVPQDDLLIEDLTVFENLWYAALQCFRNKSKDEIAILVDQILTNLGLSEKRDLKVGSTLNKVISGGQRKKLNIALELIREPSVLFLDEPTSGLSSRDSENLMDLLRDLTLKGKLIITVIHQPSSEIFKMFDKIIILDQGGRMVYFGNPVDAVIYFKTLDARVNASQGECPSCGNVNPETIFNILETQVVNEFGKYTEKRKVTPSEWAEKFNESHPLNKVPDVTEPPYKNLQRPGLLKQFRIYLSRGFMSKIANRQYVALTLLEAPILGFILSFIIRYIPDPASDVYIFSENENIPIYIFISLIVALFIGLTISAEEIFRDRKILKREHFLNLSRTSYLFAKITLLVFISGLQSFLFLIIANYILGIKGLFLNYWIALFTTAFCANMLGLNISASFNSAITIYIIIPLLIIPMMVLSGAMFPFDKLSKKIGSVDKVPVIAELMPTRWTYEALMVSQFKDNRYSKVIYNENNETYYSLQKKISEADFNKVYRLPELTRALQTTLFEYNSMSKEAVLNEESQNNQSSEKFSKLPLIKNELVKLAEVYEVPEFQYMNDLTPQNFNPSVADSLFTYLNDMDEIFSDISNSANDTKDRFYNLNSIKLRQFQNKYYNFKLEEIVTKYYEKNKFLIYKNTIVQNTDPVYLEPYNKGYLNFRTHFFAPSKYIFGIRTDTFVFNISLVLLSTVVLYLILYFDLLGRFVRFAEKFKFRK